MGRLMNKLLLIVCLCLSIFLGIASIFYVGTQKSDLFVGGVIVGIIVYISFLINFYYYLNEFSKKNIKIYSYFMMAMMFIALMFFGKQLLSLHTTDLVHLHSEAMVMLETHRFTGIMDYFSRYPHQRLLTIIIYWLYSFINMLGVIDPEIYHVSGMVLNSVAILITLWLSLKIIKMLGGGEKEGLLMIVIAATNPIFYLYASYYYTDTMSMPFLMGMIYLYLKMENSVSTIRIIKYGAFLACVFAVGFSIKSTVIVPLIAMFLVALYTNSIKKVFLKWSIVIGVSLMCMVGIEGIYSHYGAGEADLDVNSEFPISHYIAMGMSDSFSYNSDDVADMLETESYSEKNQKSIDKIKLRIKEKGVTGIVELVVDKLIYVWTNGQMEYQSRLTPMKRYGTLSEYVVGRKQIITEYWCQIVRSSLFILMVLAIINELRKSKISQHTVLYLSFFGIVLFFILWQATSRLILNFLPVLLIIQTLGIVYWGRAGAIQSFSIKRNDKVFCLSGRRVRAVLGSATVFLTIIFLVYNYSDYVETQKLWVSDRVVQPVSSSSGLIEGFKEIEQTFSTDLDFNSISIKTSNKDKNKGGQYKFLLLDEGDNVLYKEVIQGEAIPNDNWLTVKFPEVHSINNEKKYMIKLVCLKENPDIGVMAWKSSMEDLYEFGECTYFSDTECDLTFKVQKTFEGGIFGKRGYLLMAIIIIMGEMGVIWIGRKGLKI